MDFNETLSPLLSCVTSLDRAMERLHCLFLAQSKLKEKHGNDLRIHFRVLFNRDRIAAGKVVWDQIKELVDPFILLDPQVDMTEERREMWDLHLDTLEVISRGRCPPVLIRLDKTRYQDLLFSVDTNSVQALGQYGNVHRSNSKLVFVTKPWLEIIGPDDHRQAGPELHLSECNNLSCLNKSETIHTRCKCQRVKYCSEVCQRQHWPVHKQTCLSRQW